MSSDARVTVDQEEAPGAAATDVDQSQERDSLARPTRGPSRWDAGTRTW